MSRRPPAPARRERVLVALVSVLPVALALGVYAFALRGIRLAGDEPRYLIMADSLLTDHSRSAGWWRGPRRSHARGAAALGLWP